VTTAAVRASLIWHLSESGASLRRIAGEVGLSKSQVQRVLAGPRPEDLDEDDELDFVGDEAIHMDDSGDTLTLPLAYCGEERYVTEVGEVKWSGRYLDGAGLSFNELRLYRWRQRAERVGWTAAERAANDDLRRQIAEAGHAW